MAARKALEGLDEFLAKQRRRCRDRAGQSVRRVAAAARRLLDDPEPSYVDTYRLHGLPGFGRDRPLRLAELDGDEERER